LAPSRAWLAPTPYDYRPETYGDLRKRAWPECVAALAQCNADKAAVSGYLDKIEPDD